MLTNRKENIGYAIIILTIILVLLLLYIYNSNDKYEHVENVSKNAFADFINDSESDEYNTHRKVVRIAANINGKKYYLARVPKVNFGMDCQTNCKEGKNVYLLVSPDSYTSEDGKIMHTIIDEKCAENLKTECINKPEDDIKKCTDYEPNFCDKYANKKCADMILQGIPYKNTLIHINKFEAGKHNLQEVDEKGNVSNKDSLITGNLDGSNKNTRMFPNVCSGEDSLVDSATVYFKPMEGNKFKMLFKLGKQEREYYVGLSHDGRMCCTKKRRDENKCNEEIIFKEMSLQKPNESGKGFTANGVEDGITFEFELYKKIDLKLMEKEMELLEAVKESDTTATA